MVKRKIKQFIGFLVIQNFLLLPLFSVEINEPYPIYLASASLKPIMIDYANRSMNKTIHFGPGSGQRDVIAIHFGPGPGG